MSKVLNFSNEAAIREKAGEWIARLDRHLTAAEREEFQLWMNADKRHRSMLYELAKLWDNMDVMSEIAALFPLESESDPKSKSLVQACYSRPVALSCVFLLLLSLAVFKFHSVLSDFNPVGLFASQDLEVVYQTKVGEQKPITLPDKSIITLNTNTLVKVHYSHTDRRIELTKGEAHFEVAKHDPRVFTVQIGKNEVRAVGTAFNIRVHAEGSVELTVTEGRVQVLASTGNARQQPSGMEGAAARATEIMVDAGKEVVIGEATQVVEWVQPEQLKAAIAWKSGMMAFDGQTLEQAIAEVTRYSNIKFVFSEENIKRIPVAGYFKVGDVEGLMVALRTNFHVEAIQQEDTIFLSAQQP